MQPQLMKWHWKTIVSIVTSSISVALLLVSVWSIFFCVAPWCSMLVMNGLSFFTLPYTHGFITFQSKVVLLKKILGKLYYSVYCDQHKCKFKGLAIEKKHMWQVWNLVMSETYLFVLSCGGRDMNHELGNPILLQIWWTTVKLQFKGVLGKKWIWTQNCVQS